MEKNDLYIKKIQEILDYYNLSVKALSEILNISTPTLYKQMNKERAVSINTIGLILDHFQEISAEWLLRDAGNMLIDKIALADDESDKATKKLTEIVVSLSQLVHEQESQLEELREQLKNKQ